MGSSARTAGAGTTDLTPSAGDTRSDALLSPPTTAGRSRLARRMLYQPAPGDRVMIASISGLVLLILFAISLATVRSIVIPIRQFMATTELLARGDGSARFARGGIKELDTLAVSFNRMAESLADARAVTREYQAQLESRVDERTRQLQHLAEHDPLTGLPNRRHLVAHLDASLRRAARTNSAWRCSSSTSITSRTSTTAWGTLSAISC